MTKGWRYEPARHALAARGIKTIATIPAAVNLEILQWPEWKSKSPGTFGSTGKAMALSAIQHGQMVGFIIHRDRGKNSELSLLKIRGEKRGAARIRVGFQLLEDYFAQIPEDTTVFYLPSSEDFDVVNAFLTSDDADDEVWARGVMVKYEGGYREYELDNILNQAHKEHVTEGLYLE